MSAAALPTVASQQLYEVELGAFQARRVARATNMAALARDRTRLQAALHHCDTSLVTLRDLQTCVAALDTFVVALPQHQFVAAIQAADALTLALARLQPLRGSLALIDVLTTLAWQQQQQGRACVEAVKGALEPYVLGVSLLSEEEDDTHVDQPIDDTLLATTQYALTSATSASERTHLTGKVAILKASRVMGMNATQQLAAGCRLVQLPAHQQELVTWMCTTQLGLLRRDLHTCLRKAPLSWAALQGVNSAARSQALASFSPSTPSDEFSAASSSPELLRCHGKST
jgi:hypothetical protein